MAKQSSSFVRSTCSLNLVYNLVYYARAPDQFRYNVAAHIVLQISWNIKLAQKITRLTGHTIDYSYWICHLFYRDWLIIVQLPMLIFNYDVLDANKHNTKESRLTDHTSLVIGKNLLPLITAGKNSFLVCDWAELFPSHWCCSSSLLSTERQQTKSSSDSPLALAWRIKAKQEDLLWKVVHLKENTIFKKLKTHRA